MWRILVFVLFWANTASSQTVSVPRAQKASNPKFSSGTVRGISPTCRDIFVQRSPEGIVASANQEFIRRGWGENFLRSRFTVAREFRNQSNYFFVADSLTGEDVGTIGITFAEYDSIFEEDILPEEKTLGIRLERPRDSSHSGFIAELRTWSMSPKVKAEDRKYVYSQLIAFAIQEVFERLKSYPELMDKPLLHLYADELSLRFYGAMGFKKTHEDPKKIWNEEKGEYDLWWDMALSPKEFELFVARFGELETFGYFNQEYEFILENGRRAILAPGSYVVRSAPGHPSTELVTGFAVETEIEPGLWVDAGSAVVWGPNGRFQSLTPSRDYKTPEGIVTPAFYRIMRWPGGALNQVFTKHKISVGGYLVEAGSMITLFENGKPAAITVAQKTEVAPGIFAAKGSPVEFGYRNKVMLVHELAERAEVAPGIFAPLGAYVTWQIPGDRRGHEPTPGIQIVVDRGTTRTVQTWKYNRRTKQYAKQPDVIVDLTPYQISE